MMHNSQYSMNLDVQDLGQYLAQARGITYGKTLKGTVELRTGSEGMKTNLFI